MSQSVSLGSLRKSWMGFLGRVENPTPIFRYFSDYHIQPHYGCQMANLLLLCNHFYPRRPSDDLQTDAEIIRRTFRQSFWYEWLPYQYRFGTPHNSLYTAGSCIHGLEVGNLRFPYDPSLLDYCIFTPLHHWRFQTHFLCGLKSSMVSNDIKCPHSSYEGRGHRGTVGSLFKPLKN